MRTVTCGSCGGSGSVYVSDPLPTPDSPDNRGRGKAPRSSQSQRAPKIKKEKVTPERADQAFRRFVAFVVFAVSAYLIFLAGELAWAWWVKVLVVIALPFGTERLMRRYERTTRVLRKVFFTLLFIGAILVIIYVLRAELGIFEDHYAPDKTEKSGP